MFLLSNFSCLEKKPLLPNISLPCNDTLQSPRNWVSVLKYTPQHRKSHFMVNFLDVAKAFSLREISVGWRRGTELFLWEGSGVDKPLSESVPVSTGPRVT